MYQRNGGSFYAKDRKTGQSFSLATSDQREASCATHLLKNNANLRCVQELLGHKSLSTTEKYLRLTIADLKEAHAKFHPREKAA